MLESKFKAWFKRELLLRCPQLDELDLIEPSTHTRTHPDLLVLGDVVWAALEFKRDADSSFQPNQEYNVDRLSRKGFAAFVYPENAEEVLYGLEKLFLSQ